jgi:hypothetical protein
MRRAKETNRQTAILKGIGNFECDTSFSIRSSYVDNDSIRL